MTASSNELPIGVFDSGVGGLTVLQAIRNELPHENLIYLGDTARLPYGTKSPASIARYATQATARLHEQGIKLLVVACNTASAVALDTLREQLDPVPVIGVVEPGAAAAVAADLTWYWQRKRRCDSAPIAVPLHGVIRRRAYTSRLAKCW